MMPFAAGGRILPSPLSLRYRWRMRSEEDRIAGAHAAAFPQSSEA